MLFKDRFCNVPLPDEGKGEKNAMNRRASASDLVNRNKRAG